MDSPSPVNILPGSLKDGSQTIAAIEIRDFEPYRARMPRRDRRKLDRLLAKYEDFDLDIPAIGLHLIVRGDLFVATAIGGDAK